MGKEMESSREKNRKREGMMWEEIGIAQKEKKMLQDFTNGRFKTDQLDRYGFLYFMNYLFLQPI